MSMLSSELDGVAADTDAPIANPPTATAEIKNPRNLLIDLVAIIIHPALKAHRRKCTNELHPRSKTRVPKQKHTLLTQMAQPNH
jgi:hypothetical protein